MSNERHLRNIVHAVFFKAEQTNAHGAGWSVPRAQDIAILSVSSPLKKPAYFIQQGISPKPHRIP